MTKQEQVLNMVKPEDQYAVNRAADAIEQLIKVCGGDVNDPGMRDTPFRAIKALLEQTKGRDEDPSSHLDFKIPSEMDGEIEVEEISFTSLCEHHMMPFFGTVSITYKPRAYMTGLSKLARVVDGYSSRFQVQERLTNDIAVAMMNKLDCE